MDNASQNFHPPYSNTKARDRPSTHSGTLVRLKIAEALTAGRGGAHGPTRKPKGKSRGDREAAIFLAGSQGGQGAAASPPDTFTGDVVYREAANAR